MFSYLQGQKYRCCIHIYFTKKIIYLAKTMHIIKIIELPYLCMYFAISWY